MVNSVNFKGTINLEIIQNFIAVFQWILLYLSEISSYFDGCINYVVFR
jgi:hypothetical protein